MGYELTDFGQEQAGIDIQKQDQMINSAVQTDAAAVEEQRRLEEEKRIAEEEAQKKLEEERNKPNPAQEVGTALIGGVIDGVEGVGDTLERVATNNLFNSDPNWKPTWLQYKDEEEPMNRTAWGKVLRGFVEFGVLAATTKGIGKLGMISKIPGIAQAGAFISTPGATFTGNLVRGAATGVAADFVSSQSQSDTLTTEIVKVWPWFPSVLATNDSDSPAARKFKNVLEGVGLGMVADVALSGLSSSIKSSPKLADLTKSVDQNLDNAGKAASNLTPEDVTKVGKSKKGKVDSTAPDVEGAPKVDTPEPEPIGHPDAISRQRNEDEYIQQQLELDPEGVNGFDPIVNSPLYNKPDSAVMSVGSAYENAIQALRLGNSNTFTGSRVPLFTEAALRKRLSDTPEADQILRDLEKQIDQMDINVEVDGVKYTKEDYTALAAAKYVDIMHAAGDPDSKEALAKVLMEGVGNKTVRVNPITGETLDVIDGPSLRAAEMAIKTTAQELANEPSFRASEMVISTTANEVSDRAIAISSVDDVMDTSIPMQRLYDRLQLLTEHVAIAKYFRGYDLQQLKAGNVLPMRPPAEVLAKARQESENYIKLLKQASDESPALRDAFIHAYAMSNGDVQTLDQVHKFLQDQYGFKPGDIVYRKNSETDALINAFQNMMYQSVLSAPKTLARALLGTTLNIYMRPINMMIGGVMSGDTYMIQNGLHQMKAGFEGVSEAWELARRNADAMIHNPKDMPYYEKTIIPQTETDGWKDYRATVERYGTTGQKIAFHLADTIMGFNNLQIVRYPSIGLNSIDAGTRTIMGRMRLKQAALDRAREIHGQGHFTEAHIKQYEQELRDAIFSGKGELIDEFATQVFDEAALMRDLRGPAQNIDNLISKFPIVKPFFMFIKTGANALELVQKHTPLLANFNDEVRAVLDATPDNMDAVKLFGITTPAQLLEAKAVTKGRIAMGTMTVLSAVGLYTSGMLTGNGPIDRDKREALEQTGWRPRSIKVGEGAYVNYDGLEPFSSFLALIADIGDNSTNMGEAWTENSLAKVAFLIGQNVTNKSFLSGLGPFNDMISGKFLQDPRGVARIANGVAPWAGFRNEIANVMNPGMREVEKDIRSTLMNANPGSRGLLPLKRDVLDGSVLRDYDFPTRMFNSISPIQLNITRDSETRKLLRETGYDFAPLLAKDSKGNKLNAAQRSQMQNLMGQQNIEEQLGAILSTPEARQEIETYRKLRQQGVPGGSPDNLNNTPMKNSPLFIQMDRVIQRAKRIAEAQLRAEYPQLSTDHVLRQQRKTAQRSGQIDQLLQLTQENQ